MTFADLRPINILPVISKILERALYDQIYIYSLAKSIIPDNQSGFRKNHSTTSALLKITDDIISNRDKGNVTLLVSLDYSKAFDTMNHQLLCAKLKYFGFNDSAYSLIKSYLTDRNQRVISKGKMSNTKNITHGAPQGSILAPLLFIIYISDFKQVLQHFNSHFYADDTNLYFSSNIEQLLRMENYLNDDIKSLVKVSNNHCLNINSTKSSVILFGNFKDRERAINNVSIQVDGQKLNYQDNIKCLGLNIDVQLRFIDHVNTLVKKSYCLLKNLYANRTCLTRNIKSDYVTL